MNRILVCLDCPEYQKGGYCLYKRKNVGALDNACEHSQDIPKYAEPKAEEKVMEYKSAPETTNTKPLSCVSSIRNNFTLVNPIGFGRKGERVANTPMRLFPPNRGGRTVGLQSIPSPIVSLHFCFIAS